MAYLQDRAMRFKRPCLSQLPVLINFLTILGLIVNMIGGVLHAHSINMRIFTLIEYYLPLGSKNYEEKWLQTQSIGFANQLALH